MVHAGITHQFFGICKKQNLNINPRCIQMAGDNKTIPAIITSCRSTNFTLLLIIISYEIILEKFHHRAKYSHRAMPSQSILHCYPHISFRAGSVNDGYINLFIFNYTHRVLISVVYTSGSENSACIKLKINIILTTFTCFSYFLHKN